MYKIDRAEVRAHAKEVWTANLGTITALSICVALLSYLLRFAGQAATNAAAASSAPTLASYIISLVLIMLVSPMTMGLYSVLTGYSRGNAPLSAWQEAFGWYTEGRKLKTSIFSQIWFTILTIAWYFLYIIPGALLMVLLRVIVPSGALDILALIAMLALVFLASVRVLTYVPGNYILASNPSLPVISSFRASTLTVAPHKWDLVMLLLRFLPLAIPIVVLAVPSISRSMAEYYAQINAIYPELALVSPLPEFGDTIYYLSYFLSIVYTAVITPLIHLNIIGFFDKAYKILVNTPDDQEADIHE